MNKYVCLFVSLFSFGILYGQPVTSEANQVIDLSLNNAIEVGLKNNPALQSSQNKVDAMLGKFWSGISLPQPEVSINYEYIPTGKSLDNFSERTIGVSQSFEFPTNYLFRGIKLSKDQDIARIEHTANELLIISQVKSAYYRVLANQEQLALSKDNLALAEDFYRKADIRYKAGEGTNLERLTARVQFTEAQNSLEIQKNRLAAVYVELQNTLGAGKNQPKNIHLTDSLSFLPYAYTFEGLLNEALSLNPELKAVMMRVSSTSIEQTLAWSNLLPNFNLAYYRQERDGNNGYYGASFGISVPLWFMFDQRGKIQEATANVSVAESELQSTQNALLLRLRNSYTEYKNEEQQVRLYQSEIVPQADEMYRAALKSYESGEITYLEFLQAKQTLIHSRSSYINALLSYNLSLATLEATVGKRFNGQGE